MLSAPANIPATLFLTGERVRLDRAEHAIALALCGARAVARLSCIVRRTLHIWSARLDDRHHLAGLHEFELREMGMTLADRDREAGKPFWQA
jgi:uncharacterized protein YjiS (DUF1127 family)